MLPSLSFFSLFLRRNRVGISLICTGLLVACGNQDFAPSSQSVDSNTESADGAEARLADRIFIARGVYTGVSDQPVVEAVAIRGPEILAVGSRDEILALGGSDTKVTDLGDGFLYPGFVDAHAHLRGIGERELTLNLDTIDSLSALVATVEQAIAETQPGETVYGRGWIETGWPEDRFPTRDDLDPVSPDNPVVLVRADGHALLANSVALARAGISADTPDPEGGRIEKSSDGRPTGLLIDTAQALVGPLLTVPSPEQRAQAYRIASSVYAERGWTSVHNMSVPPEDVALMERLASESGPDGKPLLPIRVYNALDADGLDAVIAREQPSDPTGRIITRAIKLYADGALGSRGAALFDPYTDQPDTDGLLLTSEEKILGIFDKALRNGVQVNTHAIGDRAVRLVIDWYTEAFASVFPDGDPAAPRFRVEHAQIIRPQDIDTFAQSGLIASMQPSHAIGDLYFAPDRLGPARLAGAYAWRSLLDAGVTIAGGSDAPVEQGDPRIEFYAAVARRGLDGFQTADWHPEERVSREQALAMFTLGPARAAFQEETLGSIEAGKRADFTGFSADIMTIPAEEILTVTPVLTVLDGVIIHEHTPSGGE